MRIKQFLYTLLFTYTILITSIKADVCTESVCEYYFEIQRWQTMVYEGPQGGYNVQVNGTGLQIVESSFRPKEYDCRLDW